MNRDKRQKAYINTLEKCKDYPGLEFTPSVKHQFDEFPDVSLPTSSKKPVIYNEDVISTILRTPNTSKTLVLNLASAKRFGGGAESGALAQEEELFRKTDYACHSGKELYPLQRNEYVVTRNVTVVKDSFYQDLELSEFRRVDMIAMPGIRLPPETTSLSSENLALMMKKIETIFVYAANHGYEVLVLGALGCGVFHNPPEVIAGIFKRCIEKYGEAFQSILFAVLSGDSDSNFDVFQRILC